MPDTLKTVLIAEDNGDEVFLMRRAFSKTALPFQLRFVPNGQEAIDYLERKPPYNNSDTFPMPQAVVLDLNMPLVNGLEVLAWLKVHPTLSALPVVIHTSSALDSDRERAGRLGAHAYCVKGPMSDDLMDLFNTVADLMSSSKGLTTTPRDSRPAVLLEDLDTGFYFAGPDKWVRDPLKALDFETPARAAQFRSGTALKGFDTAITSAPKREPRAPIASL